MLTNFGVTIYGTSLKYVIMFAPLAVLFLGMGSVMRKASAAGAQLFFFIFATLIGLSLSSIFIRYTGHSITQTFLVTAIAFAGLSLFGYTTKSDISGWGSFLIMGVIGRKAGSLADYKYSKALVAYAKPWSFEEMDGFLKKPKEWIKGTKMSFAGLKNAKERAAVILYMNENTDNPLPLN